MTTAYFAAISAIAEPAKQHGRGQIVTYGANPVGQSSTVKPGGKVAANGGANPATGYSLIEASDLDDAIAKAKGCPNLTGDGSVELAECIDM
jgi:hypothetical protein